MISNIITIQELETLETVRHFSDKEALSKGYISEATLLSRAFSRLPKSYKQVQTLVTGPKGKHTTLQTRLFREIKLNRRWKRIPGSNKNITKSLKYFTSINKYYCDDKTGTLYNNRGKCLSSSQLSIA